MSPCPFDLLLRPVIDGDPSRALEALRAAPAGRTDLWRTTAARAAFAVGRHRTGMRALHRALAAGGTHADALASVVLLDPSRPLARRLSDPDPATRADAACDLAARRVRDGAPEAARAAVQQALLTMPHHAEALHWLDWLDSASGRLGTSVALAAEGDTLRPRPELGWLSQERWWRRVGGGLWTHRAASGSALLQLQRSGTVSRVLAGDDTYASLPAGHALGRAEQHLERAVERSAWGRCPASPAATAWSLAARLPDTAIRSMSRVLAELGRDASGAASTSLVALEYLRNVEPASAWAPALRARLLLHLGRTREARLEARRALRRADLTPAALEDACLALAATGSTDEARRAALLATRAPRLEARARTIGSSLDGPAQRPPARGGTGPNADVPPGTSQAGRRGMLRWTQMMRPPSMSRTRPVK